MNTKRAVLCRPPSRVAHGLGGPFRRAPIGRAARRLALGLGVLFCLSCVPRVVLRGENALDLATAREATTVAVRPLDVGGLEWVAGFGDVKRFEAARAEWAGEFQQVLVARLELERDVVLLTAEAPAEEGVVVEARVLGVQQGFDDFRGGFDTLAVAVVLRDGQTGDPLYEATFDARSLGPGPLGATFLGRMSLATKNAAEQVVRLLLGRGKEG